MLPCPLASCAYAETPPVLKTVHGSLKRVHTESMSEMELHLKNSYQVFKDEVLRSQESKNNP